MGSMRDRETNGVDRRRRLLLAGLAAPLVAGCGPTPAGDARTLVFKHAKLFGDPTGLRALLDDFERAHPGLRVRDETLPSSSDAQHQFYAINLQARSAAFDVFAADVIWVAGFARAGWLADLGAILPPGEAARFFAGPVEAVTYRGRVHAVPWFVDAGLLYYRTDLLERHGFAPPRTWDALVATALAVTAREPELRGFVWQGKQYEGLVCNALEYLHSNNGHVLDRGRATLDSPANREALAFMADLVHRHHVTPGSVTTATEEPTRHVFGQGRAVFMRNWPYAWTLYGDPASRVHGKVGVAPLPHFPGGESAATLGGWQLAVNAHSTQAQAAARLVAFLTSEPAQKRLALAYGFQPSRRTLYRDAELLARQPFLSSLEGVLDAARPRPVTPDYVKVSLVLQSAFSAAVSGLKAPGEALAGGQRALERVLAASRVRELADGC